MRVGELAGMKVGNLSQDRVRVARIPREKRHGEQHLQKPKLRNIPIHGVDIEHTRENEHNDQHNDEISGNPRVLLGEGGFCKDHDGVHHETGDRAEHGHPVVEAQRR